MAPSRPQRAVDDTRSEMSSVNSKEKTSLGALVQNSGVSKQRKGTAVVSTSHAKKSAAGPAVSATPTTAAAAAATTTTAAAAAATTTPAEVDPAAPHIDWTALSITTLHTYRTAYRLPTQASHTHPHADLIYKSSRTALRSPSAVLARQKLRDLKHQRRKAAHQPTNGQNKSRSRGAEKDRDTDTSSNSDRLLKPFASTRADGPTKSENPSTSPVDSTSTDPSPAQSAIAPEYIGRQPPTSLATAVRKHFNAQQLNEAAVVSRFTYIVKQVSGNHAAVRTDGSAGDGEGWWMGSHGREVRRGQGGDVGFRLRFTP